jgi:hypothetical protein
VAAVAAAAGETGDNDMGRDASVGASRPEPVRQALLVAPVRLSLGVAGLIAATKLGLALGTALTEAAFGAILTAFTLVVPGGRSRPWRLRPPRETARPPWWRVLAAAMFPSTYVVGLLTALALAFNTGLAAVLAGVMLAMGALALVYGLSARP